MADIKDDASSSTSITNRQISNPPTQYEDKTYVSCTSLADDTTEEEHKYFLKDYINTSSSSHHCHPSSKSYSQPSININNYEKDKPQYLKVKKSISSSLDSYYTAINDVNDNLYATQRNKTKKIRQSGTSVDLNTFSSNSSASIHAVFGSTATPTYSESKQDLTAFLQNGGLKHAQKSRSVPDCSNNKFDNVHRAGHSYQLTEAPAHRSTDTLFGGHVNIVMSDTHAASMGYSDVIILSQRFSLLQRTVSLPSDLHKTPSLPLCPVCLDTISYCVRTNCAHIFCAVCLLTVWELQGTRYYPVRCPYCRRPVTNIRDMFTVQEEAAEAEVKQRVTSELQMYNRRFYDGPKSWRETLQDTPMYLCRIWDSDLGGLLIRWLLFKTAVELIFFLCNYFIISRVTIEDTEGTEVD